MDQKAADKGWKSARFAGSQERRGGVEAPQDAVTEPLLTKPKALLPDITLLFNQHKADMANNGKN